MTQSNVTRIYPIERRYSVRGGEDNEDLAMARSAAYRLAAEKLLTVIQAQPQGTVFGVSYSERINPPIDSPIRVWERCFIVELRVTTPETVRGTNGGE